MSGRSIAMNCWKCDHRMNHVPLPFSRYEECGKCKVDLHVCYACRHYDPTVADACREDRADFVLDKDRANFCDYFRPGKNACRGKARSESGIAEQRLAALFGEDAPGDDGGGGKAAPSEADAALSELKRLFGDED